VIRRGQMDFDDKNYITLNEAAQAIPIAIGR